MKILFVHNALRSFVRVDRDILATEHEVDELDLSRPARILSLPTRIARADLVYAWFASLHSIAPILAARLLSKPSLVVVGGYDTAKMPEIGYGHMAHPVKRHVVQLICREATALIVNSKTAEDEVRRNVSTSRPIRVLYHGFESRTFPISPKREPLVLSIGNISRESLSRKGHEVFVRAGALVPEARFVLVGESLDGAAEWLRSISPSNVDLPGFLPQDELDNLSQRAAVYVQASAHEGFGCAVAEAMTAGCVPVVSCRGSLPEVVGPYGRWIDESAPASLAQVIRSALNVSPAERRAIASHIETNYPMWKRRKGLLELVECVARTPH